jgi:hypothetical protein
MAPDGSAPQGQQGRKCTDPTHRRAADNSRCLTCLKVRRAHWRKTRPPGVMGAPRHAKTIDGKPCRKCGGTERYVKGGTCVACTRKYGQERTAGARIVEYAINTEFLRWVTSPLPRGDSV